MVKRGRIGGSLWSGHLCHEHSPDGGCFCATGNKRCHRGADWHLYAQRTAHGLPHLCDCCCCGWDCSYECRNLTSATDNQVAKTLIRFASVVDFSQTSGLPSNLRLKAVQALLNTFQVLEESASLKFATSARFRNNEWLIFQAKQTSPSLVLAAL